MNGAFGHSQPIQFGLKVPAYPLSAAAGYLLFITHRRQVGNFPPRHVFLEIKFSKFEAFFSTSIMGHLPMYVTRDPSSTRDVLDVSLMLLVHREITKS